MEHIMAGIHAHLSKLAHREGAFRFIMGELAEIKKPLLIVETGCTRGRDTHFGDGSSTLFWSLLIERYGGALFSVDIDPKAVALCQELASRASVYCQDSVAFLTEFELPSRIDFLYLDSFDFEWGDPSSANHHLKEIEAIYDRLKSGCLIAVDDCHNRTEGKHVQVQKFLKERGVEPLFESYVMVWRKP